MDQNLTEYEQVIDPEHKHTFKEQFCGSKSLLTS